MCLTVVFGGSEPCQQSGSPFSTTFNDALRRQASMDARITRHCGDSGFGLDCVQHEPINMMNMNRKLHSRIFGVAILILGGILAMHMTVGGADRNQGRSMVISRYGIVAAESPLAAQAGVQILEHGGNAIDAAVAANAMMGLVAPM